MCLLASAIPLAVRCAGCVQGDNCLWPEAALPATETGMGMVSM